MLSEAQILGALKGNYNNHHSEESNYLTLRKTHPAITKMSELGAYHEYALDQAAVDQYTNAHTDSTPDFLAKLNLCLKIDRYIENLVGKALSSGDQEPCFWNLFCCSFSGNDNVTDKDKITAANRLRFVVLGGLSFDVAFDNAWIKGVLNKPGIVELYREYEQSIGATQRQTVSR